MQSLFMIDATLLVCHDADVPLRVCHDASVPLRVCHDASVPLRVCHDASVLLGYAMMVCPLESMMQMLLLDTDAILTRNFFYFQIEASSELEVKIFFKIRFILSKCHFLFISGGLNVQCLILAQKRKVLF